MAEETRDVLEGLEGYTPGPWKVIRYNNYAGWAVSTTLRGCIAERWYKDAFVPRQIYDDGEMEANAQLVARAPELVEEVRELRRALEESVKLQSHYAQLLNGWDGGRRRLFTGAEEWIARVRELDGEVGDG